jgi:hypothetical protein
MRRSGPSTMLKVMDHDTAGQPALPVEVFGVSEVEGTGPGPSDWRVAQLVRTGAVGDPGWVVLRVEPLDVVPLCEDCDTALMLARRRAWREGVAAWVWSPNGRWRHPA